MANPPPGQTIVPGIVTNTSQYPQWGVKVASDGSSYDVKEAKNESQKLSLGNQGYLAWFSSANGAGDFGKSQKGILGGHTPNLLGWLDYLRKAAAWLSNRQNTVRVVKVVVGGTMILVGLNMLTKDEGVISASKSVGGVAGAVATSTPVKAVAKVAAKPVTQRVSAYKEARKS